MNAQDIASFRSGIAAKAKSETAGSYSSLSATEADNEAPPPQRQGRTLQVRLDTICCRRVNALLEDDLGAAYRFRGTHSCIGFTSIEYQPGWR